jgi:hypothetical protein
LRNDIVLPEHAPPWSHSRLAIRFLPISAKLRIGF